MVAVTIDLVGAEPGDINILSSKQVPHVFEPIADGDFEYLHSVFESVHLGLEVLHFGEHRFPHRTRIIETMFNGFR